MERLYTPDERDDISELLISNFFERGHPIAPITDLTTNTIFGQISRGPSCKLRSNTPT